MTGFPRYWPAGSDWQGNAKRGDYIALYGHIYELIYEPAAIKLLAFDPGVAATQPYIVTSDAHVGVPNSAS